MIVGATYTQIPLIKAAKKLGYYAIVAGKKGDYPANKYADELCDVDINNPDAVLKKSEELQIDGIATCCMDLGIRSVGKVCDHMKFCGLSEKKKKVINERCIFRRKCTYTQVS